jgi:hypothetical protein
MTLSQKTGVSRKGGDLAKTEDGSIKNEGKLIRIKAGTVQNL